VDHLHVQHLAGGAAERETESYLYSSSRNERRNPCEPKNLIPSPPSLRLLSHGKPMVRLNGRNFLHSVLLLRKKEVSDFRDNNRKKKSKKEERIPKRKQSFIFYQP
jgi:hypothetical protein